MHSSKISLKYFVCFLWIMRKYVLWFVSFILEIWWLCKTNQRPPQCDKHLTGICIFLCPVQLLEMYYKQFCSTSYFSIFWYKAICDIPVLIFICICNCCNFIVLPINYEKIKFKDSAHSVMKDFFSIFLTRSGLSITPNPLGLPVKWGMWTWYSPQCDL